MEEVNPEGLMCEIVQKKKFVALVLGDVSTLLRTGFTFLLLRRGFQGDSEAGQIKEKRLCPCSVPAGGRPPHSAGLAPSGGNSCKSRSAQLLTASSF